jgi:hypothetical protein
MKSRLMICVMLLALSAVPALADSLTFTITNHGTLPGSQLGSGGISAFSNISSTLISLNSSPIASTTGGLLEFSTGMFTGSLAQGLSFTGGQFGFSIGGGAVILVNNFMGTLTKMGDDFKLLGTFSGTYQGIHFTGSTNQTFGFEIDDHGQSSFEDLHGTTTIVTSAVPEPGTLTLFGTGLMALAGAVRRKLQAGRAA